VMSSSNMNVPTLTVSKVHHFLAMYVLLRFGAKLVRQPCKASE
jgi:hypothetical protein